MRILSQWSFFTLVDMEGFSPYIVGEPVPGIPRLLCAVLVIGESFITDNNQKTYSYIAVPSYISLAQFKFQIIGSPLTRERIAEFPSLLYFFFQPAITFFLPFFFLSTYFYSTLCSGFVYTN